MELSPTAKQHMQGWEPKGVLLAKAETRIMLTFKLQVLETSSKSNRKATEFIYRYCCSLGVCHVLIHWCQLFGAWAANCKQAVN